MSLPNADDECRNVAAKMTLESVSGVKGKTLLNSEQHDKERTSRVDHKDVVVCDSRTPSRQTGLKRPASFCPDAKSTINKKRCCKKTTEDQQHKLTTAMIQDLEPNITLANASAVLRDYNHTIKILKSQNTIPTDATPSLEYMVKLIEDWKPKSEIICMYVRWSKRLRRNYHLDSISTLLCVASQCDYSPYAFLKNIKTLTVSSSSTTYGLNFKFDTRKNKEINGNKLNDRFLGLSITLRLLQRDIVNGSGTFGTVGLKSSTNRKDLNDAVHLTDNNNQHQHYVVATKPTSRFHTHAGLLGRIWLAIQHRWIAIQVVEMLFSVQLALAKSEQESLAFSFQMHSSAGPTRFDFLDPLIGVCLRFRSTSIIDNHVDVLKTVWDKPSSFVAFGNGYLQSTTEKDRIQYVIEAFAHLKSAMTAQKNITMHPKTEREVRWQMIRGYAFHFWLERVQNQKLKLAVDCHFKTSKRHTNKKTADTETKMSTANSTKVSNVQPPMVSGRDCEINTMHIRPSGLSPLLSTRSKAQDIQQPMTSQLDQTSQTTLRTGMVPQVLPSTKSIDPSSFLWTSIRLATQPELMSRASSHLLIHRDDGVDLVAELSPLEVYSANLLYKLKHSRLTGGPGYFPRSEVGKVVLTIGSDIDKYVDPWTKLYHVAREDSIYFQEHGHLLPNIQQIGNLAKAVFKYGKCDKSRCPQQSRINIGCGGQHRPLGRPETLVGLGFKKSLASDPEFNDDEIIGTIGMMTEFTWNILQDIQQDTRDGPLAPDQARHQEYARHLANYLRTKDNVGFEDVTVAVGVLYPMMPQVAEHVDIMNDSVAGYTRTGVFNMVLMIEHDSVPILLHLQVLCNFRRVIREYLVPFHSLISNISANCKQYLAKWQKSMNQVFGGKTSLIPSPFDRRSFFVDDCLPFQSLQLTNDSLQENPMASGLYLLTEISPSRFLSFSMFIDPIFDLKDVLCYDQRIELCFVASMLSNPFWFEYAITSLTRKHKDPENHFCFDVHPMNDWARETISTFGSWQGGPHNRWSPCGGGTPFPNLFGAHLTATKEEQIIGQKKLAAVVQILYDHLQWVDSLSTPISNMVCDLPISLIEEHMTSVTTSIFRIIPCQFNVFRLMVFTTLAAGCGEIKSGIHLKALIYPVKGSASFKHLINPNPIVINRMQAMSLCGQEEQISNIYNNEITGIQSQRHDQLMLYLSIEIGMQRYLRDEMECVLCESHPNRNLQCRDWFKKGRRIYDCNDNGDVLQREYGMETHWVKLTMPGKINFAFLNQVVVYQEIDDILRDYALAFGEVLQQSKAMIKFSGRNTRTSDFIQQYSNRYTEDTSNPFMGIRHRAANFYHGHHTRRMKIKSGLVLGDGEAPAPLESECNDITSYPDGVRLWDYILNILYGSTQRHSLYSARYHQHEEESDCVSRTAVFPGHIDKAFVTSAVFVPLTNRHFFTILAVPSTWYVKQNEQALSQFQAWQQSLSTQENEAVAGFLEKFHCNAEAFMKVKVEVRLFHNVVGSLLHFPANKCFHTTLIPGNTIYARNPRDLFIIHPTTCPKC